MQLLLLSCQAEISVKTWKFLLKQKFECLKNEELCKLRRLFSGAMCLFIVNGCTRVYIFTCMHSDQAVCRTVWITATEVGLINAAQMATPLEFSSSLWHS